jgi:GTPase SAR1 family protein
LRATVAMRDLYMKTGQGFLLVFSITSPSSLAELSGLRDEIIRIKDDESVPIVICGNKADLEDQRVVARTKGFNLSQRWGAPYYEASARTRCRSSFPSPALGVVCSGLTQKLKQMWTRCSSIFADKCCAKTTRERFIWTTIENTTLTTNSACIRSGGSRRGTTRIGRNASSCEARRAG